MTEIFTPREELVKQHEVEEMVKFLAIKNNLMNIIGTTNLVKEIINIIDSSESFSFRSEMARYVDEFNPVFILKYKELEKFEDTEKEQLSYSEKTIDRVYDEIISPSGNLLEKTISENELFQNLDDFEKEVKDLMLSNMFGISVGKSSENIIHLRLIM